MGRSNEQILHKVFFPGMQAGNPLSASSLALIGTKRRSLDITVMGQRDHNIMFVNQILHVYFIICRNDLRSSRIIVFVLDFQHLLLDNANQQMFIAQYILQMLYCLFQLRIFLIYFVPLQSGQSLKTHIQNRLCLLFRQAEIHD